MPAYGSGDFAIFDEADYTKVIQLTTTALATGTTWTGCPAMLDGSNHFTQADNSFDEPVTIFNSNALIFDNGTFTSPGSQAFLTSLVSSADQTYRLPDLTGDIPIGVTLNFTGKTANVATTSIITGASGLYLITFYGVTTATLGNQVTGTFKWTDPAQAQQFGTAALGTATGSISTTAIRAVYASTGDITFETSGYSSGTYSFYVTISKVG